MNNSYITIIKEKRTVLSRKRVPLNQNECTADFRIGVPFEQNLQLAIKQKEQEIKEAREMALAGYPIEQIASQMHRAHKTIQNYLNPDFSVTNGHYNVRIPGKCKFRLI